ncbi:hypothetical protein [Streptomyces avermitilis]
MHSDPYAVLHALLRAEAVRSTPKPKAQPKQSAKKPQRTAPHGQDRE